MEYRIDTFNLFTIDKDKLHVTSYFPTEAEAIEYGRQQKSIDTKGFLLQQQADTGYYNAVREIH